ncbi:hypothetical protein [Nonomuraea sp. 10N515B]|uniref:hypothetical protein n=1 Tax=Nonomuraea sp. 10N515B TaxID=3457422 RepID=UPI003FCC35DE
MAVAVLGLVHLTRRRATVLGHVAGALTMLGYLVLSSLPLGDPVEWWLGQHYTPSRRGRASTR